MAEIDTGKIVDGITLTLRSAFPESFIECDTVMQSLRTPAFVVLLVSAEEEARMQGRWRRMPRFDILYFPEKGREECHGVADTLCTVLEEIKLPGGDRIRGRDKSFSVTDGVLHFLISYPHYAIREKRETDIQKMESLQIEERGN